MSIESAIEKMDRDNRDYLKDLSFVYKKTKDPKVAKEMLTMIQRYDSSCSEKELKLYLSK